MVEALTSEAVPPVERNKIVINLLKLFLTQNFV